MKKEIGKKNDGLSNEASIERPMEDRSLEQRIAEKAYELFQKRGGSHGYHLEDWLEAERMIRTEGPTNADRPTSISPKTAARPKSTRKRSSEQKAAS